MHRKKLSFNLRLWHWLNAVVISALLLTVLMRNVFLNAHENMLLIIEKSKSFGLNMSEDQALKIARLIRDQVWQWHPIIGFGAIALLVYRLFIFFREKKIPEIKSENKSEQRYLLFKKYFYWLFYLALSLLAVTGLLMYWDESFGIKENLLHNIEDVHASIMWFIIIFVVIHIVGVIRADKGTDAGLISDMFNGGENQ